MYYVQICTAEQKHPLNSYVFSILLYLHHNDTEHSYLLFIFRCLSENHLWLSGLLILSTKKQMLLYCMYLEYALAPHKHWDQFGESES